MLLDKEYFANPDTILLARDLIGKVLLRRYASGEVQRCTIIETEAYHGEDDKACHARFGKTNRNQIMYHQGGVWYVYLCYGIHWLLNIVTGPEHFPSAILIRGVDIATGPGRVTKTLTVDKQFNTLPAVKETGLWIETNTQQSVTFQIEATPRIGVDYAGECAKKPWRFVMVRK